MFQDVLSIEARDDKKRKPLCMAAEDIHSGYRNQPIPAAISPEERLSQRRAAVQAILEYGTPVERDDLPFLNALQSSDFNPRKIVLDTRAQTNAKLRNKLNECGIQALPRDLEKIILAFAATPELPAEKRKRTDNSGNKGTKKSKKARS